MYYIASNLMSHKLFLLLCLQQNKSKSRFADSGCKRITFSVDQPLLAGSRESGVHAQPRGRGDLPDRLRGPGHLLRGGAAHRPAPGHLLDQLRQARQPLTHRGQGQPAVVPRHSGHQGQAGGCELLTRQTCLQLRENCFIAV